MKKIIIAFLTVAIFATGVLFLTRGKANSADVGLRLLQTIPQHGHSGPTDGGVLHYNATVLGRTDTPTTTVTANSTYEIMWTFVAQDPLGLHSMVTNTSYVTVPKGYTTATVQCSVSLAKTASQLEADSLQIYKNNSFLFGIPFQWYVSATNVYGAVQTPVVVVPVSPGDYFRCFFSNNDAVNDTILQVNNAQLGNFTVTLFR